MTAGFHVYDTTLRDGAQREGLSFSVKDKLEVARRLDGLGVGFIEGGWPGSNPRDTEFFRLAKTQLRLATAELAAFGSTRRPGGRAADDRQVGHLRDSGAGVITLVAKADVRQVERALRTTPSENLAMIHDTVSHLRSEGLRVFLDAEHFFDGYLTDPDYARAVLCTAADAGAEVVALCDTNGGMLPHHLADIVHDVVGLGVRVGIHAHDDTGCAVANTLIAVDAGATHVQGTANGYGERCGNADLFSVLAGLETRMGLDLLPEGGLRDLSRTARAIAEIANVAPDPHQPWVGSSAFAHKAGLHVSAVRSDPSLYQHIDPACIGNETRLLVSDLAGRATVLLKGHALGVELDEDAAARLLARVKQLESCGHSFEAAEGSFELYLLEEVGRRRHLLDGASWHVVAASRENVSHCEAVVAFHASGEQHTVTGVGDGPVHALDEALRLAVLRLAPALSVLELVDYEIRVLDGRDGAGAVVRVLVTTTDGRTEWSTVGAGPDILAASWQALVDSIDLALSRAA